MLNIIVCVKVVMDPEAPVSTFRIDPEARRVIPGLGIPPVLNPYDENGLEAALRIKELRPGRITVLSLGKDIPKTVLKKVLAVGADDLIVLEDDIFENLESYSTAYVLAEAIKKAGDFDLILAGRMAADTNAGQVGLGIAEFLRVPSVSEARAVVIEDGKVKVQRVLPDGYEVIEVPLPCVVTVSHELGELRSASIQGITAARKQPFTTWSKDDLKIELSSLKRSRLLELSRPQSQIICEILDGETSEVSGVNLALKLKELKLF